MKKREIKLRAWDSEQKQMFKGEIDIFDHLKVIGNIFENPELTNGAI
jgi:hypothetical protein